jgi:hypothetical protein
MIVQSIPNVELFPAVGSLFPNHTCPEELIKF